jgi:hypothetical protein
MKEDAFSTSSSQGPRDVESGIGVWRVVVFVDEHLRETPLLLSLLVLPVIPPTSPRTSILRENNSRKIIFLQKSIQRGEKWLVLFGMFCTLPTSTPPIAAIFILEHCSSSHGIKPFQVAPSSPFPLSQTLISSLVSRP